MRRLLALLATIAALTAPLSAQNLPAVPAISAASPVDAAFVDSIKLGRSTDRMTVPVSIGDRGPFPFIVDTGAERSVVSRELADYLKLGSGADVRLFDFTGALDVGTARIASLKAGQLVTPAIEAPMLMMDDIGAPGMLGIDALQGYRVVLDFARRRMQLMPAQRHAVGDLVLKAESRTGQLIVTKAWFEGVPISVVIDTGSWLSVGNSAMRKLATKRPPSYGAVSVVAVTGRQFDADYVSVEGVKIGGFNFQHFGLVFADVPPFARFGLADRPALILGISSLQLFDRVELDFANREIAFTQRRSTDFRDVCQSSRACFSLRQN